jgi:hypothetical protein
MNAVLDARGPHLAFFDATQKVHATLLPFQDPGIRLKMAPRRTKRSPKIDPDDSPQNDRTIAFGCDLVAFSKSNEILLKITHSRRASKSLHVRPLRQHNIAHIASFVQSRTKITPEKR